MMNVNQNVVIWLLLIEKNVMMETIFNLMDALIVWVLVSIVVLIVLLVDACNALKAISKKEIFVLMFVGMDLKIH